MNDTGQYRKHAGFIRRVGLLVGFGGLALVLGLVTFLVVVKWDWITGSSIEDPARGSETLRNLGLLYIAIIALWFAAWRSWLAHRQTATQIAQATTANLLTRIANRQAGTASRQAELAERGHLNDRYQKGADMLGNPVLAVRLGGIFVLHRLAGEHPDTYDRPCMELLCAFASTPPKGDEADRTSYRNYRLDVYEAVRALGNPVFDNKVTTPDRHSWSPRLVGVDLRAASLAYCQLGGVYFRRCCFDSCSFHNTVLTAAFFNNNSIKGADFSKADLKRSDFFSITINAETKFHGANVTGATIGHPERPEAIKGLTKAHIDQMVIDEGGEPPTIHALDAETGEPLVWKDS